MTAPKLYNRSAIKRSCLSNDDEQRLKKGRVEKEGFHIYRPTRSTACRARTGQFVSNRTDRKSGKFSIYFSSIEQNRGVRFEKKCNCELLKCIFFQLGYFFHSQLKIMKMQVAGET